MTDPLRLRLDVAPDLDAAWVTELVAAVVEGRGWVLAGPETARPDSVVQVVPIGDDAGAVDEPVVIVRVEPGTPRSPIVEESAPHLTPRLDLTVGAFRARRNQRITLDALERFVDRVERTRPEPLGPDRSPPDPAEAVARAAGAAIVAENDALLVAVDSWLARTAMTPDAARAVTADRAILAAALTAPTLDLVIIERAATRLAAAVASAPG